MIDGNGNGGVTKSNTGGKQDSHLLTLKALEILGKKNKNKKQIGKKERFKNLKKKKEGKLER